MRIGYTTPATGTSGTEVIRYDNVFVPEPSGGLSVGVVLVVLDALRGATQRKSPRIPM